MKLSSGVVFGGGRDESHNINEFIMRMGIKIILNLEHFHFNYLKEGLSLSSIKLVAPTQELKIFLCYEGLTLDLRQE